MRGVDRIARELVAYKEPSISGDSGIHSAASEKIRPVLLWHRSRDGEPKACGPQAIFLGEIAKGSRPNLHAKAAIAGTHLVSEQLQIVSPASLDHFDSTIVELPIHHGGRPNLGRYPRTGDVGWELQVVVVREKRCC